MVRLYLAAALQRLSLEDRGPIARALLAHAEDADDPNLPYMLWFAVEPFAGADPAEPLALAAEARIPRVQSFLAPDRGPGNARGHRPARRGSGHDVRPGAAAGDPAGPQRSVPGTAFDGDARGLAQGFGRAGRSTDAEIRNQTRALSMTFGDPAALREARQRLADRRSSLAERRRTLESLLKVHDPELAATLQGLLAEPSLRGDALRGLAAYDDPKTSGLILGHYLEFTPEQRRDAEHPGRACPFGRCAAAALESKQVPARDLSADIVRQIRNHKSAVLDEQLVKLWGTVRDTPADKAQLIARFKTLLAKRPAEAPDRMLGRAVFARTCQQCHTLFDVGRKVGPDLTGSNRARSGLRPRERPRPDALIGNDYQAHVLATTDGRVLTGLITAEDQDAVTLATANETIVVPKKEIEEPAPATSR